MEHVIENLQQNRDDADLMTDSFYKSQDFIAAIQNIVSETNATGRTPSHAIESPFSGPLPFIYLFFVKYVEIGVDYFVFSECVLLTQSPFFCGQPRHQGASTSATRDCNPR